MPNKREHFKELHTSYYPMVHQICMGFLKGDEYVAADLTQEVFINIWRSLDKFRGASSYKTWIYRITMNTCLKYIRDNKVRQHAPIEEHIAIVTESKSTDHHQALYQAIGQLNKVDRLIIMMVLDDLDYSEIAEVVGISEGNLRVKIHRIKKSLKSLIKL